MILQRKAANQFNRRRQRQNPQMTILFPEFEQELVRKAVSEENVREKAKKVHGV